jgi:hypothetical protein
MNNIVNHKSVEELEAELNKRKKFDHRIAFWGIILVIATLIWAFLNRQIINWISDSTAPETMVVLPKAQAQLSLNPQTKTIKSGETFAVDIILNTSDKQIDGVDIYSLHYDPSLMEVIDDMPDQSGIQIKPGTILEVNAANIVEPKNGSIKFSQVTTGGSHYVGSGVLATIHFKALTSGTAYLKFDFIRGETTDSNAAYHGKDQLSQVVDGIYTIQK